MQSNLLLPLLKSNLPIPPDTRETHLRLRYLCHLGVREADIARGDGQGRGYGAGGRVGDFIDVASGEDVGEGAGGAGLDEERDGAAEVEK
jgi:hypothetical protein